jgi:hypothetical protein
MPIMYNNTMLNKVTLANGSQVTWEEFSRWSAIKQRYNLCPTPTTQETRSKISKNSKSGTEEVKAKIKAVKAERGIGDDARSKMGWSKGVKRTETNRRNLQLTADPRQIHTPNGIFANRAELIDRLMLDLNLANRTLASNKISYWLKRFPNDYYIIEAAE